MANQQGLPLNRRFHLNIADTKEKREKSFQKQKEANQDDILRLANGALPPPTGHNSQHLERSSRSGGRAISDIAETNRQTSVSGAETREETARLREALEETTEETARLRESLENAHDEVRRLRDERREVSKQLICAVCEDRYKEIEKCRRREDRLVKMLRDKEQIIKEMEQRLDEGWERERNLKRELREAERRAEASEQRLWETANHDSQHKDRGAEGKESIQKRGGIKAGNNGWEFRCKKGGRETPLRAAWCIVTKGATYEKGMTL